MASRGMRVAGALLPKRVVGLFENAKNPSLTLRVSLGLPTLLMVDWGESSNVITKGRDAFLGGRSIRPRYSAIPPTERT